MKLSRRGFLKTLAAGIGAALIPAGQSGCRKRPSRGNENPYAYDIDQFKKVDPALMVCRETGGIDTGLRRMNSLTLWEDDAAAVSSGRRISIYGPAGGLRNSFQIPEEPAAVSALETGHLAVAFATRVDIYSVSGKKQKPLVTLESSARIGDIAVKNGVTALTDTAAGKLQVFDHKGRELWAAGSEFLVPGDCFAVDIDSEGSVWAVNPGRHCLEKFSPAGARLSRWGKHSMEPGGFSGCCNPVDFIIGRDGGFITSEKGLLRVTKYTASGTFLGIAAAPASFSEGISKMYLGLDSRDRIYVTDSGAGRIRIFEPLSA